jgi:hypothetical protein
MSGMSQAELSAFIAGMGTLFRQFFRPGTATDGRPTLAKEAKSVMLLYHYTSFLHFAKIIVDGRLGVTDSNLSRDLAHAAPNVVWLTGSASADSQGWGRAQMIDAPGPDGTVVRLRTPDKTEIRFTVDVPAQETHNWPRWSHRHGIENRWFRSLALAAPGSDPDDWWVIERPVIRSEWKKVLRRRAEGGWIALAGWETEPDEASKAAWMEIYRQAGGGLDFEGNSLRVRPRSPEG